MAAGERLLQQGGFGIGIAAQFIARDTVDSLEDEGRWGIGMLIGIELDQSLEPGLFARDIGRQPPDNIAPVMAPGLLALPGAR
jgi:hypothetical protein